MPDQLRIRVGSKTHKGVLKEENNDRILIGMDPAANDWLYSPDEILTGEFGTLILLADGLSHGNMGGKAAVMVCRIIKKMFDETLELPPDDDDLLLLLKKFFKIAHRHLILYGEENEDFFKSGASATMVLIKDFKAYVIWSGNTRLYRFASGGVQGSVICALSNLEGITIDHSTKIINQLSEAKAKGQSSLFDDLISYLGHSQLEPEVTGRIVKLQKGDKLLLCSDGIFNYIKSINIEEVLSQDTHPEILCEDIVNKAFNANAGENMSAITVEVMNGDALPVVALSSDKQIDYAKKLLSPLLQITSETDPEIITEREEKSIELDESDEEIEEEDIEPMKVRTVLPDQKVSQKEEGDKPVSIDSKDTLDSGVGQSQESEEEVTIDDDASEEDIEESDENSSEQPMMISFQKPVEGSPEYTSIYSRSKPRISTTAYPDPDDHPGKSKNDPLAKVQIAHFPVNQFLYGFTIPFIVPDPIINTIRPTKYTLQKSEPTVIAPPETLEISESKEVENFAEDIEEQIEEQVEEQMEEQVEEENDEQEESIGESVILPEPQISQKQDTPSDQDFSNVEETTTETDEEFKQKEETTFSEPAPKKYGNYWRIGIVALALTLIPVLMCWDRDTETGKEGDMSFLPNSSKAGTSGNEKLPAEEDDRESKTDQTGMDITPVTPPEDVPLEEVTKPPVEEKKKTAEPQPEPQYDNQIRDNKHQLIDEIDAMISRKNQLCRQINTYKRNAPAKKTAKIEALWQDCDQLDKKFSSIYDQRTGYFKTVRYDFLNGTIKNIRFSMEQLEEKFTAVRNEE